MKCGQRVNTSKLEEGANEVPARYMKITCCTWTHAFVLSLDQKVQNASISAVEDADIPICQQGLGR